MEITTEPAAPMSPALPVSSVDVDRHERTYPHRAMSAPAAAAAAAGIALLAIAAGDTSVFPVLVTVAVWSPATVGLGVLLGRAGLLSLGQAGLIAVGAYAGSLAVVDLGVPVIGLVPLAMVASAAVALLTAPILRLTGLYFVLATLTITFLVGHLLVTYGSITGGAMGLVDIPVIALGGEPLVTETQFLVLAGGCGLASALVAGILLRGPWGRELDLVHHDETNASALGVHVSRVKAQAWVLNGALAGMSGGLYALYNRYLAPEQFGLHVSLMMLAAILLGGASSALGPFLGLLGVFVLPELIGIGESSRTMLMAIILVVFAATLPDGLASLRLSRRKRVA